MQGKLINIPQSSFDASTQKQKFNLTDDVTDIYIPDFLPLIISTN